MALLDIYCNCEEPETEGILICGWCGKPIEKPNHHHRRYHEECTEHNTREKTRIRVREHRKKYKDIIKRDLGTGNLHSHRLENPEEEHEEILKELKRLRLR